MWISLSRAWSGPCAAACALWSDVRPQLFLSDPPLRLAFSPSLLPRLLSGEDAFEVPEGGDLRSFPQANKTGGMT